MKLNMSQAAGQSHRDRNSLSISFCGRCHMHKLNMAQQTWQMRCLYLWQELASCRSWRALDSTRHKENPICRPSYEFDVSKKPGSSSLQMSSRHLMWMSLYVSVIFKNWHKSFQQTSTLLKQNGLRMYTSPQRFDSKAGVQSVQPWSFHSDSFGTMQRSSPPPNTLSLAGVAIEVLEELFVAPAPLIPKCNIVQWGDSRNIKQQRSRIDQGLMRFMPHLKTEENWLFISSFGSLYRRRQFRWWGFSGSNQDTIITCPYVSEITRETVWNATEVAPSHWRSQLLSRERIRYIASTPVPCAISHASWHSDIPWHTVTQPKFKNHTSRAAGVQCMLDSSW